VERCYGADTVTNASLSINIGLAHSELKEFPKALASIEHGER
jgi:hypothetical protein